MKQKTKPFDIYMRLSQNSLPAVAKENYYTIKTYLLFRVKFSSNVALETNIF